MDVVSTLHDFPAGTACVTCPLKRCSINSSACHTVFLLHASVDLCSALLHCVRLAESTFCICMYPDRGAIHRIAKITDGDTRQIHRTRLIASCNAAHRVTHENAAVTMTVESNEHIIQEKT